MCFDRHDSTLDTHDRDHIFDVPDDMIDDDPAEAIDELTEPWPEVDYFYGRCDTCGKTVSCMCYEGDQADRRASETRAQTEHANSGCLGQLSFY